MHVVILEGLDLAGVAPGRCDLLPLRLARGAGAPAWVLLRRRWAGRLARSG